MCAMYRFLSVWALQSWGWCDEGSWQPSGSATAPPTFCKHWFFFRMLRPLPDENTSAPRAASSHIWRERKKEKGKKVIWFMLSVLLSQLLFLDVIFLYSNRCYCPHIDCLLGKPHGTPSRWGELWKYRDVDEALVTVWIGLDKCWACK